MPTVLRADVHLRHSQGQVNARASSLQPSSRTTNAQASSCEPVHHVFCNANEAYDELTCGYGKAELSKHEQGNQFVAALASA